MIQFQSQMLEARAVENRSHHFNHLMIWLRQELSIEDASVEWGKPDL